MGDISDGVVSLWYQVLFLATGIITTICNQLVTYNGAGEKTTLLLSAPTYLGMMMVAILLLREDGGLHRSIDGRDPNLGGNLIFLSALVDVVSNVICMVGLHMIGSGLFQVVYAAVVCFAAMLSRVCLHKRLTWIQTAGIGVIFVGLAVTSMDAAVIPDRHARGEELEVLAGIAVTLAGCVGYAGSYVLNEYILLTSPALAPKRLCTLVGWYGTLLLSLYMGIYTFPNWKALVVEPIAARHGDAGSVGALYVALTASSFLHNLAYFNLLRRAGAVATGVLTALRTVGVFFASAALFCDVSAAQCMTSQKLIAVLIVCSGVVLYAVGKPDLEAKLRVAAAAAAAAAAVPGAGGDRVGGAGAGAGAGGDRAAAAAAGGDGAEKGAGGIDVLREMLQEVLE